MKIIIVYGPTASGKSDVALKISQKYNGEIICADSMQIYKDMNIGTNKPTKIQQNEIPHHLLDFVDPCDKFSVAEWVALAKKKIEDITKRNRLPIICGGTGLYLKSLLFPFSFSNVNENEKLRQKLWKIYDEKGADFLYNILKEKDKILADKVHPNNIKRVIRYLEITESNKFDDNQINKKSLYDYKIIYIESERENLYEKINKRVDLMFEQGLEQEVNYVFKKYNLNKNHQSALAIGYREFFEEGNVKEKIKQHTRNYAKRQMTFAKTFPQENFITIRKFEKNVFQNIDKFLNK